MKHSFISLHLSLSAQKIYFTAWTLQRSLMWGAELKPELHEHTQACQSSGGAEPGSRSITFHTEWMSQAWLNVSNFFLISDVKWCYLSEFFTFSLTRFSTPAAGCFLRLSGLSNTWRNASKWDSICSAQLFIHDFLHPSALTHIPLSFGVSSFHWWD